MFFDRFMVEERRAAGVVVECKGKFLIVHRTKSESEPNTWALPAGTIEKGEKPIDTVVRELREETGLEVKSEDLKLIYENTWNFPGLKVYFPIFKVVIDDFFDVKLASEDLDEYKWVTPEECYKIKNLIHGFRDVLKKIYDL